jgi:predicted ATPase
MTTLNIRNLGQIKKANLSFGDLTVLVGPQATGKSIALQLLKLMLDAGQVQAFDTSDAPGKPAPAITTS